MEGLEPVLDVRPNFLSAQLPSPPCQRWGLILSCWSRSPESRAQADSVPFKCMFVRVEGSAETSGGLCAGRGGMHCLRRSPWQLSSDSAFIASPLCLSQPITAPASITPGLL